MICEIVGCDTHATIIRWVPWRKDALGGRSAWLCNTHAAEQWYTDSLKGEDL